ncbi:unnamed protein product [Angiostrongylus costaricensis]|uniref:Uncharacterized protein n=1 Tax=Angiostrongylus costaricensis TaxID=334426 RepID=A0A0R3PWJ5_ANGCS|nr:unnamed protein product [Angiostrongylus costaricensis]
MTINEEWSSALFGERGLLTGIFRMLDQQRKSAHSIDFKKIFDALLMGSNNGNFKDPLPELPEFLGLCNRLSCGDIYKAIDKFRRSELFSNFQTALSLLHDPNGWETIGKLLSNPELISQFIGGTNMGELLGSALGQAKKHSAKAKEKNSKLTPDDGDFGTEFSDGEESLPEVDFSTDDKGKNENEDYYEQVDVFAAQKSAALPEISFSIDGDDESDNEDTLTEIKAVLPSSTLEVVRITTMWTTTTEKPLSLTTFPQLTITSQQTTRNHRKESDYYAMYYND